MTSVPPSKQASVGGPHEDPWIVEAKRSGFVESLEDNIHTLEESLRGGKEVSPEFVHILEKDIDMLRAVYRDKKLKSDSGEVQKLNALNLHLGQIIARFFDKGFPGSSDDVVVPEARPRINIEEFQVEIPESDRQELRGCSVIPIKGDGHCLFRSIAAHLLTLEHIQKLRQRVDGLQKLVPEVNLRSLFDTCEGLLKENKTVDAILLDPEISKRWISALRGIATQWWVGQCNAFPDEASSQAFMEAIRLSNTRDAADFLMAHYLSTMGSYDEACWGGEQEVVALQKALDIPIHLVDLETPAAQRKEGLLPRMGPLTDIYLLRRPGHYDALYLEKAP